MPYLHRSRVAFIVLALGLFWLAEAQAAERAERMRSREGQLGKGLVAPDFTLASPDGKTTFTLSEHKGKQPVVLIFGSYT